MGYTIDLISTDKKITKEGLREVISEIPKPYRGENSEQEWGWSLICDLSLSKKMKENGNETYITLGGAFGSQRSGILTALLLQQMLQSRGHRILINSAELGYYNREALEWLGEDISDILPMI